LYKGIFKVERQDKIVDIVISDKYSFQDLLNSRFILGAFNYKPIIDISFSDDATFFKNDLILKINNEAINSFGELQETLTKYSPGSSVIVTILREESEIDKVIVLNEYGQLGVSIKSPVQLEYYGVISGLKYGIKRSYEFLYSNSIGLYLLIRGKIGRENLSGPIGIAQIYGSDTDVYKFIYITAILSLIIGMMNILPIPGLDGGHIFIDLVEVIFGRKIPIKIAEIIQMIGIGLIILLILFASYNDIYKLFI